MLKKNKTKVTLAKVKENKKDNHESENDISENKSTQKQ